MAYLTSDTGATTIGQGKTFVYMTDENTGQQYVYSKDPGDDEGFQNNVAPPEGANLKIGMVLSKTGSEGEFEKQDIELLKHKKTIKAIMIFIMMLQILKVKQQHM